ncbi:Pvc16 family protein [Streptomyces afghaniensis]|uniref:Pvc16 family protein n=1 Tax=Streptomyces TaxID=1883 RepID=UPI001FAFF866|nr:Pvc16 family protein [Streptomyces sp. HP-A2021]UOB15383.1 Pvc16 family protein [Streptomyces sp. HP-A2021]
MFHDLDATLKAMLGDEAAPEVLQAADVTFLTPDKDFKPVQDTVNLFLHDIRENRTLRDQAPLVSRTPDDTFVTRRPPVRVDCTYLATVWSHKTGAIRAEDEHRMLGELFLWFSRFPVLDKRFLRGSVAEPPQLHPLPASIGSPPETAGAGPFWTALGVTPRPALSLTVTLAMEPAQPTEPEPPVREISIRPSVVHPVLRGRLLEDADGTHRPVSGASVEVVEEGLTQVTDAQGDFAFQGLDFGGYTLLVRPSGRPDLRTEVEYRSGGDINKIILPRP